MGTLFIDKTVALKFSSILISSILNQREGMGFGDTEKTPLLIQ